MESKGQQIGSGNLTGTKVNSSCIHSLKTSWKVRDYQTNMDHYVVLRKLLYSVLNIFPISIH
jgi:hypothetical protein